MCKDAYSPPFNMTDEITTLVIEIGEYVGRIAGSAHLSQNPTLRRQNRIQSIHSSLAIEQNSLTLSQVTDVINGKRVLAPPQDIREVKNAYEAYEHMIQFNPYQLDDLLNAHRFMMSGLIADAGCFRSSGVGVFSNGQLLHAGTPPQYVPDLMNQLFDWLKTSSLHPLVKSCVFHYEFEFIHPFSDGNGRTGRLWHTLILQDWKPFFAWLPIETLIFEHQADYYDAINISNAAGDSTRFVTFMLTIIRDALAEIVTISDMETAKNVGDNVGDKEAISEKRCLELLRAEPTLSAKKLAAQLQISSRQVERILSQLKRKGLIERVGSARGGQWVVLRHDGR